MKKKNAGKCRTIVIITVFEISLCQLLVYYD